MKFIKFTFAILLTFVVFGVQAQEKKEQKLVETMEKLRLTLIDPNESTLYTLTSPKLSYGHSAGAVEDQKTFIDNMVNGKSDFVPSILLIKRLRWKEIWVMCVTHLMQ